MSGDKYNMTSKIKSEYLNSCKKMRFNVNENQTYMIKEEIDIGASGDYGFPSGFPQANSFTHPPTTPTPSKAKRVVIENSLPQIAIKKKNSNSPSTSTEVVLLNGNWDTSNSIPNIVAEMHNVKMEELQSTWVGDIGDTFFVDSQDPLHLKSEEFAMPIASPRGSDSGLGSDSPEGNLSWLLNFKLDEIPGLPDCPTQNSKRYTPRKPHENQNQNNKASPIYIAETIPKQYFEQHRVQNVNVARIIHEQSAASTEESSSSPKSNTSSNTTRPTSIRKPPFTYTELIEHALREKGELTVSGIYQWISDHFSFFKANDDRWKNSVRHNLSINPHFRKGSKAIHGAGHLWTIAQKDDTRNNSSWNIKRQRMEQFMQRAANEWQQQQQQELELAVATASIMPSDTDCFENNVQVLEAQNQAQISQTANEILGGMKRDVEVQYIIPVSNAMDFMCPVSKEQVAKECGLGTELHVADNDYLITDLNPNTLGLNLSEAEIITTDQLFSDDLNFQCYELQSEQ